MKTIGIIPAHAGLTSTAIRMSDAYRDHPRACGAHNNGVVTAARNVGSSPRMRGSPRYPAQRAGARRIIPAHAGLTYCPSLQRSA